MIVMKFGGSSLSDAERIRQVGAIVKAALARQPLLVLSAMGETTDYLLEAGAAALKGRVDSAKVEQLHSLVAEELGWEAGLYNRELLPLIDELRTLLSGIACVKELTARTKDYLLSFGERLSVRLFAAYLRSKGLSAQAFDAWELGLVSDSNFNAAEVIPSCHETVKARLQAKQQAGILPVVTGFLAKNEAGDITTLGRGGSDLSATLIATIIGAEEVQVWKDVDGILTADPRVVTTARPVALVSYEEAAELAYFGAQVLHPRSMLPCIQSGIPVRVMNSYNPTAPGTRIVAALPEGVSLVRAITSKRNVTVIDIVSSRMLGQYGFLARVFAAFEELRLSVDMVASSEVSISLTLDAVHDLATLKRALEKIAAVDIKKAKAIVTLVGDVKRSSEILRRTFTACSQLAVQVQMVSQGASKVNISFIIDDSQAAPVVQALHEEFFGGA